MKKILLPTDFSDNSWNAIKYALQLFKDTECNFVLLNTYTPIIFQYDYSLMGTETYDLLDAVKETSSKGLDTIEQKIKSEFSNPKHTITKLSSFNTLTAEIEELNSSDFMDFIIMGTHGASGIKKVLFGSNTVHIFNKVKCPVLAIPSGFNFESPHEILFPSDYGIEFEDKHLSLIFDIASLFNARVNILNVTYESKLSESQEKNRKKLEAFFKPVACLFHEVHNKNVSEAITGLQQKVDINFLAMINNKHSFFENIFFKSTVKQIGFHLKIPFLVIPS